MQDLRKLNGLLAHCRPNGNPHESESARRMFFATLAEEKVDIENLILVDRRGSGLDPTESAEYKTRWYDRLRESERQLRDDFSRENPGNDRLKQQLEALKREHSAFVRNIHDVVVRNLHKVIRKLAPAWDQKPIADPVQEFRKVCPDIMSSAYLGFGDRDFPKWILGVISPGPSAKASAEPVQKDQLEKLKGENRVLKAENHELREKVKAIEGGKPPLVASPEPATRPDPPVSRPEQTLTVPTPSGQAVQASVRATPKIDAAVALDIHHRSMIGETNRDIADHLGMSIQNVSRVVTGTTWGRVTGRKFKAAKPKAPTADALTHAVNLIIDRIEKDDIPPDLDDALRRLLPVLNRWIDPNYPYDPNNPEPEF